MWMAASRASRGAATRTPSRPCAMTAGTRVLRKRAQSSSLMEMSVHVPCVLALRFVLTIDYPVLLQDCPLVDE